MTHLLLGFSLICFFVAGLISEYRINRRLTWLDEEPTDDPATLVSNGSPDGQVFVVSSGKGYVIPLDPNVRLQREVDKLDEEWRRIYERGK